jgi:metal-responsive CopG/Arc/MetJ family transcriptional regulator
MARAKTVGFTIPEDMLPDLEIVINEFAGSNRSEFVANERPSPVLLTCDVPW